MEVADSSVLFDKRIKLPRYAAAGIPEVWIVNIPEERIEVYGRPSSSGYAVSRLLSAFDLADAERVSALGRIPVEELLNG